MIDFALADWGNPDDRKAVVQLLQAYAMHPMGGAEPLSDYASQTLPDAMAAMPGAFSVIGWQADDGEGRRPVALANCFTAMSTFACKPLINIHDLYVDDIARGKGAGQRLLDFVEEEASSRQCCKVTLEVLTGNDVALRAYERFGFEKYVMDDKSGHAVFMHKKIAVPT